MGTLKPIETVYDGYRFRSRLEARWAILFDALGIKWEYEPEGFQLSDGTRYLPDFYLPDSSTFFEVKGLMTEVDHHKVEQLVIDSGKAAAIGYADFTFEACDMFSADDFELTSKSESFLARCRFCGKMYFCGYQGSYACRCCGAYDGDNTFEHIVDGDGDGLPYVRFGEITFVWRRALDKAKSARFEHGETPNFRR